MWKLDSKSRLVKKLLPNHSVLVMLSKSQTEPWIHVKRLQNEISFVHSASAVVCKGGRTGMEVSWGKFGFESFFSTPACELQYPIPKNGIHITLSQRHHEKTNISKIAEGFKNTIDKGAGCTVSWISNKCLPRAFKLVNKFWINDLSLCHFVTHYFRHKAGELI